MEIDREPQSVWMAAVSKMATHSSSLPLAFWTSFRGLLEWFIAQIRDNPGAIRAVEYLGSSWTVAGQPVNIAGAIWRC